MPMQPRIPVLAGLLATGAAASLPAHHSFAMFDAARTITISGTVKEFQWTNPHIWIQIAVPDEQGVPREWGVEGASPTSLVRRGWTRKTLQPGDKISLVVNPLRDGTRGGNLIDATLADGTVLTRGAVNPR